MIKELSIFKSEKKFTKLYEARNLALKKTQRRIYLF